MATQSIGSHVTVKGDDYVITEIRGSEGLGSKFYGKFRFILWGPDNTVWSAYGKRVAHNSTLTPVEPAPVAAPVEAERCEHMSGGTGCALTTCPGTPDGVPLDRDVHVIGEPTDSEPGVWSVGREIADKVRYYAGVGVDVSAVTYSDSGWYDRRNTRQASGWAFSVNGTPVSIIAYETRTPLTNWRPAYAVYVDSAAYVLDVDGSNGRHPTPSQLAYVVTRALDLCDTWGVPTRATVADTPADTVTVSEPTPAVDVPAVADVESDASPVAERPDRDEYGNLCAYDANGSAIVDGAFVTIVSGDGGIGARGKVTAVTRTGSKGPVEIMVQWQGARAFSPARCDQSTVVVDSDGGSSDATPDATPDREPTPEPVADVEHARELSHLSVTVDRAALLDAVTHAAYAAATRTNVPVLAGARLSVADGVLSVSGFDYEVSITVRADALPDTPVTDGVAVVNAATLKTMVAAMPEHKATRGRPVPVGANQVTLTDTGRSVRVTSGTSVRALPTLPAEDYPQLPAMSAVVTTVDGTEWSAQVARVTPAAGRDDTLPMLTGVHVTAVDNGSAIELAATDRYRLTLGTVPASGDAIRPMVAPARLVAYVGKIAGKVAGPVGIGHGDSGVTDGIIGFTFGRYTVTSRLLEGDFPNVRALMPGSSASTLTVDGATVAATVDSVATVAGKSIPVVVRPDGDTLTLTVGAPDGYDAYAEESVSGMWDGTPGFSAVAFNPAYLSAGLKAMPDGDVTLSFQDARRPVVVRSDSLPTFSYLVMPVRIGDDSTPARTPDTAKGTPVTEPTPEPVADVEPEPTPVHDPSGCCAPDMCGHDHTADAAPVAADAQPATAPDVPALHAATETAGQRAFEAWQAGHYAEARALLNTAESLAPSPDYLLGGSKTFDWVHARITADETAARAAADAVPTPDAPEVMPAPVADPMGPLVPATVNRMVPHPFTPKEAGSQYCIGPCHYWHGHAIHVPAPATADPMPEPADAATVEPTPARAVAPEPTVTPEPAPAPAPVASHDGPPVYRLAKYTGARGVAYRASHRMVRDAVHAATNVWPDVRSVNGNRRVFTVDAGAVDAATVDGIVRAALALPDGSSLLADVPAVVSV